MTTQQKNIRSHLIICIFIAFLTTLLFGCSGMAVHADEKDKFVQVIIDDREIKDKEYGSKFVGMIKESLSHSFEKVSVQTGYDGSKEGKLVVMPQSLDLSVGAGHAFAKSTVKVLTNKDGEIYNIVGSSKVDISAMEWVALFPVVFVGGVVAGIVGGAIGEPEAAAKGAVDVVLKPWEIAANKRSLEIMAEDFQNKVMSAPKFKTYAESAKMANVSPANLKVRLEFTDAQSRFPNNTINAGEESILKVTITNDGKGAAFDVKLNIDSNYSDINFEKTIAVGDIQSGGSKEVNVNLRAGYDLKDGKAPFSITCSEKRGYDAQKVVMNIPAAKLDRPKLAIVSTEINDGNSGLANGNGNNIIESGETIELVTYIKNSGVGPALGVNLVGSDMTPGVQWVQGSEFVGRIEPGKTVKAKLAFSVPRNFDVKNIAANLRVADERPVAKAEYQFAQGYAKKTPDLQYAYQLYSNGAKVATITNGGGYEVELTISNKGQMDAKNVVVNVAASSGGGISVSRSRMDIGDVKERGAAQSQRFTLSVPRTYNTNQAPLTIKIAQEFFPSFQSTVQIPVDVKSPNLSYIANLVSKNHGNTLEQREQAVFEVQVINNGTLAAEGVKIALVSNDEDLQIQGQKEVVVGTIPPGASADIVKFPVSAKPRLHVGEARLGVNITQNEFAPFSKQYALNILDYEEGATIIDVAGENRPKTAAASSQAGPKINIKGLEGVAAVIEDETYPLAFEVADVKSIAKITVLVNGRAVSLKEAGNLSLKAAKSRQIVQDIPLDEGENKIAITAYNSDNIPSKREFTVTRATEEDIDTPKFIGPRNPNAVAVVIGISKFKNDIPPIAYARRDAETMKQYLLTTLGYREKNIQTFYDEEATVTELKSYFSSKMRSKIKQGVSDVFVFYSGHGTPDTNTQEPYFVPYNFDQSDPVNTGLAANDLYKQLGELGAKSVTIVLDSCFSGKSSDGKQLITGVSAGLLKSKDPFFGVKHGVLLTAATKEQPASWYEKKQHGLFTYYFLQGLQGAADYNKDGVITVEELSAFTRNKVSEQALSMYNREQTPEVKGDGAAVMVRYK